jgi:CRISPR-associated protein Csb2
MPFLRISTRFLASAYHGRLDGGEPEWPPSPLRLFQAFVSAATNGGGCALPTEVEGALRWLERLLPPSIVAPPAVRGTNYRLSVPNNSMDIVARAWSRRSDSTGGDANPSTHRTMKTVRTTYMDDDPVYFLWHLEDDAAPEARVIAALACRIVALGWGIDLVVADGDIVSDAEVSDLDGIRWTPRRSNEVAGLRVPFAGTLDDVLNRHRRFLNRLLSDHFDAPPPLTTYATVAYQQEAIHVPQPFAVFSLLNATGAGFRSFDAARRALTVAGMTRHATKAAAARSGWPETRINQVVLGHAERSGDPHIPVQSGRFAYVPLPSLEPRDGGEVIGSVRRVMVTLFAGEAERDIAWVRRALAGQALVSQADGTQAALLGTLPYSDAVTRRYLAKSSTWVSVTPVVLPGYDDPGHYRRRLGRGVHADEQRKLLGQLDTRTDRLIRKAIVQASFSPELAEHARVEWRRIGFWAGTEPADRYGVPDHLKRFTRLHVRIEWRDRLGRPVDVAGPCVLGGGRFFGLGLLAA